jgi:sugar transferase (PEP-CTERM/EpsH1 system associated)
MRIMHVVRTLATGGTEMVVRRLLGTLEPSRFQQSVCTLVAAPGSQPLHTICLEHPADKPAFLIPQLTGLFRRERPDIVHSRNWATIEAVLAAKLAGIPAIVHSEHGRDLQTMGHQPWRRRMLRRISYACADRVFCVSEELREFYCEQLGIKSHSLDVIPNGVDVKQFCPNPRVRSDVRAKLAAGPNMIVVGTVGRLDPIKDHITLLRAADLALRKGVDLKLVIVGEGPQRAALESQLSRAPHLSSRTVLTGESKDVADWLNSLDIFVLPSLSEGMSNTLLEAMAVGVAPIATAVGGNREVVEHEHSGLLVPPGDAEQISDLIVQLAAAAERRKALGRSARERIETQFSIERMVKRYGEMYSEVMNSRSARSLSQDSVQRDSYVRDLRDC